MSLYVLVVHIAGKTSFVKTCLSGEFPNNEECKLLLYLCIATLMDIDIVFLIHNISDSKQPQREWIIIYWTSQPRGAGYGYSAGI